CASWAPTSDVAGMWALWVWGKMVEPRCARRIAPPSVAFWYSATDSAQTRILGALRIGALRRTVRPLESERFDRRRRSGTRRGEWGKSIDFEVRVHQCVWALGATGRGAGQALRWRTGTPSLDQTRKLAASMVRRFGAAKRIG